MANEGCTGLEEDDGNHELSSTATKLVKARMVKLVRLTLCEGGFLRQINYENIPCWL
jgi:hypothetical protein